MWTTAGNEVNTSSEHYASELQNNIMWKSFLSQLVAYPQHVNQKSSLLTTTPRRHIYLDIASYRHANGVDYRLIREQYPI